MGNFVGKIKAYPFWPTLWRHRKRYILGLISLAFVDAINVALPLCVKAAMDALGPKDFRTMVWAGIGYLVLMAAQSVGRYLWRIYLIGTSHLIATETRLNLYSHLQKLPLPYYQRVRTGDLMSRATNDIESLRMAVGPGILVTIDAIFIFLFIVPVMFALSWKLTLLAFAFYPIVPVLTLWLGKRIDELFESLQQKLSAISAHAQETFSAIRLIKSLVLEPRVEARFLELSQEYRREGMSLAKYQAAFSPALSLITNLGTFLILLLGGMDVINGVITVGTFVAFQRFVVQLSWPMEAIGWAVTMTKEGAAANRRLDEILEIPQVQSTLTAPSKLGSNPAAPVLEIRDLKFSFTGDSGALALQLPTLHLEEGARVGIVGSVGSGKTTLFNLILRLYEPQPGQIFYRGQDVTSIPLEQLRQRIASVEQQVFLFSEKIRNNITLGNDTLPESEAVESIAKQTRIFDEIVQLEKGFDTILGERGINLSGGQKQRIALSRALARRPELLLLDDSFSAIDVDIEDQIIRELLLNYPKLTLLFASHRLSMMRHMDEIWLIANGRLSARGTHEQLLKDNFIYQELWMKSEKRIAKEQVEVGELGV